MIEQIIISQIHTVLPDLAMYHDFAPQTAKPPLAVLSRVGGSGSVFLDDMDGYEIRLQITVWAADRLAAITINRQIEQALYDLPHVHANGAAVATHDAETDWRGMRQDFLIFEQ